MINCYHKQVTDTVQQVIKVHKIIASLNSPIKTALLQNDLEFQFTVCCKESGNILHVKHIVHSTRQNIQPVQSIHKNAIQCTPLPLKHYVHMYSYNNVYSI